MQQSCTSWCEWCAGVPSSRWPSLDGAALQPILAKPEEPQPAGRADFVVSQFHGDNQDIYYETHDAR